MKTSFTLATVAAVYLAMSAEGQNFPRFLQDDTCQPQDTATFKSFEGECVNTEGAAKSE
jgi:hypothetical protein